MLAPSFNASEFPMPDNKSAYKDSGTGPVENDSKRTNANQTSRDRHSIARVRTKIHKTVTAWQSGIETNANARATQ